jgi:hypothetical protein
MGIRSAAGRAAIIAALLIAASSPGGAMEDRNNDPNAGVSEARGAAASEGVSESRGGVDSTSIDKTGVDSSGIDSSGIDSSGNAGGAVPTLTPGGGVTPAAVRSSDPNDAGAPPAADHPATSSGRRVVSIITVFSDGTHRIQNA